jgi:hypothetical protein
VEQGVAEQERAEGSARSSSQQPELAQTRVQPWSVLVQLGTRWHLGILQVYLALKNRDRRAG